ncbi:AI-2E family transporter [Natronohydrobacter thiooxidans]|jgi:predicted PurR-regulated permease PerM|uniref:AI-2E family transporter n=1 Tax=Natronohydrobacter thiooxidans TaxID=87172 RepID=UPI0008FF150E|nr:AI-2E family transporter [Natronohydrobacter thiooxidans]
MSVHPGTGQELPRRQVSAASNAALVGIFIILLVASVQQARSFLMPVFFSLLLFFVLMPVHRRLQRLGLNGHLVAGGLVLGLLIGLGAILGMLAGPVRQVTANLPEIVAQITARLSAARDAVMAMAQSFGQEEQDDIPTLRPPLPDSNGENGREQPPEVTFLMDNAGDVLLYLAEAPAMVAQLVFALVLLFFLLSSSRVIYRKIIQSFSTVATKRAALSALRETENKLCGYLGAITLINAGLGICVGLAMWWLGMPVPLLFGTLAFLLNFIPYLGAVMGITLASTVALLWFDTLGQVLAVGLTYLALTTFEGQLVTPSLLAQRLRMTPVPVFLSVAFWAWMWGFMGMLIAVPILVALRVIAEQIRPLRGVARFLSAD